MNVNLESLARLAWLQVWQVTVVAILVGAVVRFCCRKRPRLAYALWMLVVVKAIVPPLWSSPTGLFCWALVDTRAVRPDVVGDTPGVLTSSPALVPVSLPVSESPARLARGVEREADPNRGMDWSRFYLGLFSLWSTGLVICTGYVLAKQIVCATLIRRSRLPTDERYLLALGDLSRRLGVKRRVRLMVTSRPIGPAAFGLVRPSILLPEPLLAATPAEQVELILAHELMHVRRGDILAGKLQLVAQLIWWFNPLIWWASGQAGRERERCCDEEVVAGVRCKPALYARTLLRVVEQKSRLQSIVALPGVRVLEVTSLRLESIMKYTETNGRRASRIARLGFTLGLFLLVPGMGMTLHSRLEANDDDGPPSAADTRSEQEKLQGKWKIVRCEFTGQPDTGIVGVEHTIAGGKWLRPGRGTAEYRLSFDSGKDPKWVDLAADRLGDRTLKGIYSLEGDRLTICYAYNPDLPRPTEFITTPNTVAYLYVLERVKNDNVAPVNNDAGQPSPAAAPVAQTDPGKIDGKWKIVRCEFTGRPDEGIVGVEHTIAGGRWLRPGRRTAEYRLKFDPGKDPLWVDLAADRLADRTLKGIYMLQGDRLTICYAYDPALPRPLEFKTTPSAPAYLYVLERVKK